MNIDIRFIDPELFYLVDEFCDREGIKRLLPDFCRVVAALDLDTGKIVGIMCLQLIAHAEPIWIQEEYQNQGVWREMADVMDGYLQTMADQGVLGGVYTQPTRDETRAMCEKMGYFEAEHPLYVKLYKPVSE